MNFLWYQSTVIQHYLRKSVDNETKMEEIKGDLKELWYEDDCVD